MCKKFLVAGIILIIGGNFLRAETLTQVIPKQWGIKVTGVKTKLDTKQKVIALTFDACGSSVEGCGYDSRLIDYLERETIPATLFLSGRWVAANPFTFLQLARNPLFEIENHGLNHKPCSVNGRAMYGIKGTASAEEVVEEVEKNARRIWLLTGNHPKYYRPATCYCDEIAVEIVRALGYEVVGFSVLGDAGATYSKKKIKKVLLNVPPGSIVIFHMNHPEGETAEGIMEAVPILRQKGFRFAKLSDYKLK